MITKGEFSKAAFSSISEYPTLETRYQAKDPQLIQHIEAIATMLAMFSAQLEVAQAEPFEKTRTSTVLADAAMRGIIPKATPATLKIKVENTSGVNLVIGSNRVLIDANGRYIRTDTAVDVNPSGIGYLDATQLYKVEINHTVTENKVFYEIPISMKHEESLLCGIRVFDAQGREYAYTDRYAAAAVNDRIFHIEVDERQNFYIRFGYKGIVGIQPTKGDIFTIQTFYTFGRIDTYTVGDQVSLETNQSINDAYAKLSVSDVVSNGEAPIPIEVLRELSKYPSVYNKNAVYLGDFDFLVRSNFPSISFLSVWGESAEEIARAPNIKNINCLFVAVVGDSGQETYEPYVQGQAPTELTQLTALQTKIKTLISQADDSYKVRFYKPMVREITVNITAKISTSYDANVVKQQIKNAVTDKYGQSSVAMSRGKAKPRYQDLYEQIRTEVSALKVGNADLQISIEDLSAFDTYPEIWQYIGGNKLNITVLSENVSTNSWGIG